MTTSRSPAPAARTGGMYSSRLRELIGATTRRELLSLAGGLPPDSLLPYELVAEAAAAVLGRDRAGLQYSTTEGEPRLRARIVSDLAAAHGIEVDPGRCLVTTGSQQALDLVAKVLIDPGDPVVVESPAYVGALRAFAGYQPTLVEVPTDREGLDVEELERLLSQGLRPKLVYLVANFSNPRGHTTSSARRVRLAWLAEEHGFLVVEDDPYAALRFAGEPLPPVLASTEQVLYLGSFSKVVAPGLRVGYAIGPVWLVRLLAVAKQATDLNSSALSQRIVLHLLEECAPQLAAHGERLRQGYADRAASLQRAVERHLSDVLTLELPEGGMFAWGELTRLDALAFAQACHRHGVAVVPGDEFTVHRRLPRGLRLSFSMLEGDEFDQAAVAMRRASEEVG